MIPKTVLAYMAGLLDGEGSIFIMARPNGRNRFHQLKIHIVNTQRDFVAPLQQWFGGNETTRRNEVTTKYRPIYRWEAVSQDAVAFLKAVRPYVILKRCQVWIALEFTAQRTIYTRGRRWAGITEEERALREGFRLALKCANGRLT